MTEDIDIARKESIDKITALNTYLETYPTTVIVDSLEAVTKVISRERSAKCLQNVQNMHNKLALKCPFTQPKFVIINNEKEACMEHILVLIKNEGFGFPVICKPVEACGTPNSHRMVSNLHVCICICMYLSF